MTTECSAPQMRQLFEAETCTHSFLLFDGLSREGVLIDCVKDNVARDMQLLEELDISLKYLLETHVHADHVTGAGDIREETGARIIYGARAGVSCADCLLDDGQSIHFGPYSIEAISTPGHTSGCTTYKLANMLFTGDTLLIRSCGRTDFQEGSSAKLYESVTKKLFTLPDETLVYPAHDYKGLWQSTIGEEKNFNPRLGQAQSLQKFQEIMENLHLAYPKRIDIAVPANMRCGRTE